MASSADPDSPRAARQTRSSGGAGRSAFLALRFANEVWTICVLAWAGASFNAAIPVRIVLAVALPSVFAVFWGLIMAPRSKRRLPHPARMITEIAVFGVSAGLLALSGHVLGAVIYVAVSAGAALASPVVTPED